MANGRIYWNNLATEVVEAIKNGKGVDLVNDLVTGGTDKALTAEQGKVLKGLVDKVAQDLAELDTSGITTADIINDLTTGGANKVLSAEQGKALKALIDEVKASVDNKVDKTDIVDNLITDDATKVLSAKQGKILKDEADDNKARLDTLDADLLTATEAITNHSSKKASKTDLGHVTVDDATIKAVDGQLQVINPFTSADKTKLDGIDEGANKYVLPVAGAGVLGGVKQGVGLTIDADGTANVNFPTTLEPKIGEFITTVSNTPTKHYVPNIALTNEDYLQVFYNGLVLQDTDWELDEMEQGTGYVITLSVEQATDDQYNNIHGTVYRGFKPLQ